MLSCIVLPLQVCIARLVAKPYVPAIINKDASFSSLNNVWYAGHEDGRQTLLPKHTGNILP